MTAFKAGVLTLVVIVVATYFGFTKANPFANPFELNAVVRDAQNLKSGAPVRIAGVDVGRVTKVEPTEDGQARVHGDDGAARRRAPPARGRDARHPLADPARGQLLRRPSARLAVHRPLRVGRHDPDHAHHGVGDAAGHPLGAAVGRAQRSPDAAARVRHEGARRRRRRGAERRHPVVRAGLPLQRAHQRRAARRGAREGRAAADARPAAGVRGARRRPGRAARAGQRPEHDGRCNREPGQRARGSRPGAAGHPASPASRRWPS